MILHLEYREMATLSLHMSIMRKNVRKGFKSNYKKDAKKILDVYDEVKDSVTDLLEEMDEQEGNRDLGLNMQQVDMLSSFLVFYIGQLKQTLDEAKDHLSQEDMLQIDNLQTIKNKIDELMVKS